MLCKLRAGQHAADAAWRAQAGAGKAVEFSHENGQLTEALKIFGACGGPAMAPHGASEFLRGWRAKQGASFADKSAIDAPVGAGPATLGLGPLRRSSGELCLPDGATQATTVATAVQAAVVPTHIPDLALTGTETPDPGSRQRLSGRRTAVLPCGGLKSIAWVPWLGRVAQAAQPTQGARRPRPAPRPAPLHRAHKRRRVHTARAPRPCTAPARRPCSATIARPHALAAGVAANGRKGGRRRRAAAAGRAVVRPWPLDICAGCQLRWSGAHGRWAARGARGGIRYAGTRSYTQYSHK